MKVQAGLLINNAKKLANVIKSRTDKKDNNNQISEIKKYIIRKGSKILNIKSTQTLLQSEISKRQHLIEGIGKLQDKINKTTNLENINNSAAEILSKYSYGGENILNSYIKSYTKLVNINTKPDLNKFNKELLNLKNKLEKEINVYTDNIYELEISENNILSLNDINQKELLNLIDEIKNNSNSKQLLSKMINNEDLNRFLNK